MSSTHQKTVRQRFCLAPECRALFFVCADCDRGQAYCDDACRRGCRAKQQRAASSRYQKSPAGQLAHRNRQRAYRQRRAAIAQTPELKDVTHQGLEKAAPTISESSLPSKATLVRWQRSISEFGLLLCHFCSFKTVWIAPFYGMT